MPTVNHYFNNFTNSMEQNLVEDLIIESIRIYGIECLYIPRTLVKEDLLFGEDVLSKFDTAYPIEMYVKSVDGFEGDGTFLSKFGLEIRDQMILTMARRRFVEEVYVDGNDTVGTTDRPNEGDLIYFPLNNKLFEIKFVEHEAIFYQMGSLQTYDVTCELFEYSHERLDTGVAAIDNIETAQSGDVLAFQVTDEAGNVFNMEDGSGIVQENYRIEDTDDSANNEFYTSQTTDLTDGSDNNFIDWTESNPFGEL
jgi:hypothetical protein